MIRTIGAALIIISTSGMGIAGVARLRRRVKALSAVLTSLDIMESEICSRLAPMADVMEELAETAPPAVRELFRNAYGGLRELGSVSFADIWSDAVKSAQTLLLTEEETETISELGLSLGKYDVAEQAAAIRRVRLRVERYLYEAEKRRDRDSRLHTFFGVASGVFAVIILL